MKKEFEFKMEVSRPPQQPPDNPHWTARASAGAGIAASWPLQSTRRELLKAAEAHLDAATKATIAANESMKGELVFQGKECDRLIKTNAQLVEENRCLRLERQLLVQSEQEFGKRNHA